MVYHLLTEWEPFSDVQGGAISRWVANVARGTECVVACPACDLSWGFDVSQLFELPAWKLYGRLETLLVRGGRLLEPALKMVSVIPFQRVLDRLSAGDILWIHNRPGWAAYIAPAMRSRGIQVVLHMHNLHLAHVRETTIYALRDVPVVCCSKFVADNAKALFAGILQRVYVLHNGADEKRFLPTSFSLIHDSLKIAFSGRLIPEKGVHVLLRSMRILQDRGIAVTCEVIGGGGLNCNKTTAYVHSLLGMKATNTTMAGYLSGKLYANALQNADIFCCPSIWQEPFGMVIPEAMASGLPVVASSVGGIPEILQYGGGVCVPPNNAVALADALECLIVDRNARERMAAEGLQSFRENFVWQIIQKQYLLIIKGIKI